MPLINFSDILPPTRYQWMTQAVIPRPVAWVLTENEDGGHNLAPFSYFNALASAPALLGFSVGIKPNGNTKDTLVNIRTRPYFVIHIGGMKNLPALNESAAPLPYGESEIQKQKLALENICDGFPLPRLRDAPLTFACHLHKEIALSDTQSLIIGEILHLHIADHVIRKDSKGRVVIDAKQVNPIARLGAGQYANLAEEIMLQRPE